MEGELFILLVERDAYAAEFTEHFLRSEGYEVSVVFSAEEALEEAVNRPPDLAIVDLLLSGAHGQRLCSQLVERTSTAVVAVSSLASAEVAHSVGAAAFLQKPIEPIELIDAVQKLLDHREPTR